MLMSLWPSEDGKTAIISIGNEAGGELIATVPYETKLQKIRAHILAAAPEMFEELDNLPNLAWWGEAPCAECYKKGVRGPSPALIQRVEDLIKKAAPEIPDA